MVRIDYIQEIKLINHVNDNHDHGDTSAQYFILYTFID